MTSKKIKEGKHYSLMLGNFGTYFITEGMLPSEMTNEDNFDVLNNYFGELSNLNTPAMPPNIFARSLTLSFQMNITTNNVTKIQYGQSFDIDETQVEVDL